jgi:hypothetical protein
MCLLLFSIDCNQGAFSLLVWCNGETSSAWWNRSHFCIYLPTRRKQSFRRISIADCSEWFVGVYGSLILIVPLPIWQEQATRTTRDESEAFQVRWEKLFVFGRATLKKLLMMRRHECESKEWFISDSYLNWLWLTFASTITLAASLSCVKGSLARFIITC